MATLSDTSVTYRGDDHDDAITADTLHSFYHQLLQQTQQRSVRNFYTGSSVEIKGNAAAVKHFDVRAELFDVDAMAYSVNQYAFPRDARIPNQYIGEVIRIYSDGSHVGYTRLVREKDGVLVQCDHILGVKSGGTRHGPAILVNVIDGFKASKQTFSASNNQNEEVRIGYPGVVGNSYMDKVVSVHCPFWPQEATEWISRRRLHGSPKISLIESVIRHGCDFVQVPHKLSHIADPSATLTEWRFSFSKAELILIRGWNYWQRVAYRSLHLMHKLMSTTLEKEGLLDSEENAGEQKGEGEEKEREEALESWSDGETVSSEPKKTFVKRCVHGTALCTYFMKTLMLWAVEEKSFTFWSEENIFESICELLNSLKKCIKTRYLANYFIPGNNMMDYLKEGSVDLSEDEDILERVLDDKQLIHDVIRRCRDFEKSATTRADFIKLPAWIKRSLLIYIHANGPPDNFAWRSSEYNSRELKESLTIELFNISKGLECAKRAAIYNRELNINYYKWYNKAENFLTKAANLHETRTEDTLEDTDQAVGRYMLVHFYKHCNENAQSEISTDDSDDNEISDTPDDVSASSEHITVLNENISEISSDRQYFEVFASGKQLVYNRQGVPQKIAFNNFSSMEQRFDIGETFLITRYIKGHCESDRQTLDDGSVKYTEEMSDDTLYYTTYWGRSPTVSISYYIAMALLANLYYFVRRDYKAAVDTCDEVITIYRTSLGNQWFAEHAFPIILSTRYAPVYDDKIQEMLGFYSLCTYIFIRNDVTNKDHNETENERNSSVCLGVCPIAFALYVKTRSVGYETAMDWTVVEDCWGALEGHLAACDCDKSVNNGKIALLGALQNWIMVYV